MSYWLDIIQPENLVVWRSIFAITYHMLIPYRTTKFESTNIFLQWQFGNQPLNLILCGYNVVTYGGTSSVLGRDRGQARPGEVNEVFDADEVGEVNMWVQ